MASDSKCTQYAMNGPPDNDDINVNINDVDNGDGETDPKPTNTTQSPQNPPLTRRISSDVNLDDEFADIPFEQPPRERILDLCPTPEFSRTFSTLYTLFHRNEMSMRAFRLITSAIKLNPSNPTAWVYRRKTAESLNVTNPELKIWERELAFTGAILKNSRKNYQVWEYRRHCVKEAKSFVVEFDFIDVALNEDVKNYHAWAHRSWLTLHLFHQQDQQYANILKEQYSTTEFYIQSDVRNNSAWNFRAFLLLQLNITTSMVNPNTEVDFACEMVPQAPRNESTWNYLLALQRERKVDISKALTLAHQCIQQDENCIAARRFLILAAPRDTDEDVRKLQEHCTLLANGIDPIRKEYWLMKHRTLKAS